MVDRSRRRLDAPGLHQGAGFWSPLLAVGLLAALALGTLQAQAPPPVAEAPRPAAASPVPPPPPGQPVPTAPAPPVMNGTILAVPAPAVPRFQFKIAPNTPLKELLPVPPKTPKATGPVVAENLRQVPEVEFQMPLARDLPVQEGLKQTAHLIARVNHLNGKQTDGFLKALGSERPDLAGLPFAMGDACRTKGERSRQFALAVALVRSTLQQASAVPGAPVSTVQAVTFVPSALPGVPPTVSAEFVQVAVPAPPLGPAPAAGPPVGRSPATGKLPLSLPAPAVPDLPPAGPKPSAPRPEPRVIPPAGGAPLAIPAPTAPPGVREALMEGNAAEGFWERYQAACLQEDKDRPEADRAHPEEVTRARIAALMQVLAPESPRLRQGLVKYLATISDVEATRALARLAIYSTEDEVRAPAVEALRVRRERDYTEVLLQGLRYPWPAVARRAAAALVKLERTDLVPKLVDLLDEPDPRNPFVKEVNDRKVPVVQELVRINHHRNCLLCHAPGNTGAVSPDTLTAQVPVPGQPLPSPSEGYQNSIPDVLVRVDVTYLRQDFSAFQPVADANPWPEMQRFDFLVRTRELTEPEAATYRAQLSREDPSRPSPYRRAVLAALRELTGRDTGPTGEAWRELLDLPAPPRRTAMAR